MFYQEALPKFHFLSRVDSLLTIRDRHWRKVAATFEKGESANSLPFAVYFHMGAYFCMGAYKRVFFLFLFFFMRTNLCNALVIQENSYTIANIYPEAVNTLQENKQNKTKQRQ